jgi:hypothetical protein
MFSSFSKKAHYFNLRTMNSILYGIEEGGMFGVIRTNVAARTIQFWAKYCDGPVEYMMKQPNATEWVDCQLQGTEDNEEAYCQWNAASLGSIAYLACNAPEDHQRELCTALFHKYVKWVLCKGQVS